MSRETVKIVFLMLFAVIPTHVQAQQTSSSSSGVSAVVKWPVRPILRDPEAITVVQAAIDAMGGAAAVGSIATCIVNGTADAVPGALNQSGSLTWESAGLESKWTFDGSDGTAVESSGHGHPFRVIKGVSQPISPHLFRAKFFPSFVPITLLRELQDANYSIQNLGTTTVDSEEVTIIRLASEASPMDSWVTPQDWYFSTTTKLPVEVDRRLPDPKYPAKFGLEVDRLSHYQAFAGASFPLNFTSSIGGNLVSSITVTAVKVNPIIQAVEFDQP